jgi:ATPase subunit of ABC transporter with duplicated ATPase domains
MNDLDDSQRIRVLLAQALFADPDILLLDEPTNHLDVDSILWLEEFLINFKNTVVVVSHDRHFLNKVCTHTADIDFQKIQLYTGNYDFWRQASELALKQKRDANQKSEDKAKELKAFIARFSANASKSRQATARKKMLDKLSVERILPSSRKYPHIVWEPEKLTGKELLTVKGISLRDGGETVFDNLSFTVGKGEKVVFVGDDGLRVTALLEVLAGARQPSAGAIQWGGSVRYGYFPKDHGSYFRTGDDLITWLGQFSEDGSEQYLRTFLGRMLFNGEEAKKSASVLSGGEKVRCMIAKLMHENPHVLILDGPTNHLDLESITALNDSLVKYAGTMLFASHDVEFIETLADRVIEVRADGLLDRRIPYGQYLEERAEKLGLPKVA